MRDLNEQIADALSLVGILLVFVFAYFTAMWPSAHAMLDEEDSGRPTDPKTHRRHEHELTGLIVIAASVVVLLIPLTVRIFRETDFEGPFDTARAGVLMVDLFLLAMIAAGAWTKWRLRKNRLHPGSSNASATAPDESPDPADDPN